MIEKRGFLYSPKGKNRTLHIYLPRGYDSSGERYPVMYFFDGHNLYRDQDATYGKSWGLETFLDRWSKDMIVVGMECSHEGNARLDEYSPYTFPMGHWGMVHGMGNQTMDWIVNEVKPMIDREYRTWPHREATGIAGSSMGGLMAVYAVGRYNRWFSKAGCISSAMWFCMEQLRRDILNTPMDPDTRVYFSWGTEESGGAKDDPAEDFQTDTAWKNREAASWFESRGARTWLRCQRFGGHREADWEKLVPEFMDFLWLG